jgi:AcrR family transcriptional regulator
MIRMATLGGNATAAFARLTLRQRNLARLRLRVLDAVLALTATRPLADVSVREICEIAEISQGTFFNHFPSKEGVLVYYMRLWSLRAAARARTDARGSGWAALQAIFRFTAEEIAAHPNLMFDIVAFVAQATAPPAPLPITRAERLLAVPDVPDDADIEPVTIDDLLAAALDTAIEHGEVLASIDTRIATRLLKGLFYGLPLAMRAEGISAIGPAYDAGLEVLQIALRTQCSPG